MATNLPTTKIMTDYTRCVLRALMGLSDTWRLCNIVVSHAHEEKHPKKRCTLNSNARAWSLCTNNYRMTRKMMLVSSMHARRRADGDVQTLNTNGMTWRTFWNKMECIWPEIPTISALILIQLWVFISSDSASKTHSLENESKDLSADDEYFGQNNEFHRFIQSTKMNQFNNAIYNKNVRLIAFQSNWLLHFESIYLVNDSEIRRHLSSKCNGKLWWLKITTTDHFAAYFSATQIEWFDIFDAKPSLEESQKFQFVCINCKCCRSLQGSNRLNVCDKD